MFLFQSSQEKKIRQDVQKQMQLCLRNSLQSNQDKYKKSMQAISKRIQENNQKVIEMVVDQIKVTIKEQQFQPNRKYMAIKLLRDLMKIQIKNKNKSLAKYILKKILKRLKILASHRSNSKDQDRGKDLFKGANISNQKYSILFLNQLLLALEQWAKTSPGPPYGFKTQFDQVYRELVTSGVQFPKQIVKGPSQQAYKSQDGNRNSSPYSSVPKKQSRQSLKKSEQKSPIKIPQQKPKKQIVKTGGLNDKQVNEHFDSVFNAVSFFLDSLTQAQQLGFLQQVLLQMAQLISKGDEFVMKVPQAQRQTNPYILKIDETFQYSKKAMKDYKKAQKDPTQFQVFKKKLITLSKNLLNSLSTSIVQQQSKIQPKIQSKPQSKIRPDLKVQVSKNQKRISQQQKNTGDSAIKRLSVPRVTAQNAYSSISGKQNNWVIKQKSQYNSNTQREEQQQQQSNQKFRSFGIGGIGQKIKKQSSKQKSGLSNELEIQKKNSQQPQEKIKSIQNKTKQKVESQKKIGVKEVKNKKRSQTQRIEKDENFGNFQISDEKKDQNNQQFYFDQPSTSKIDKKEKGNKEAKEIEQVHQKSKDMWNDSGFKKQSKVDVKSQKSGQQYGDFFGDFGGNKQKEHLPIGNRNPRRQKTTNATAKQIQRNQQNPFQSHTNSNLDNSNSNFSAFNKDKSSLQGSKNPNPNSRSSINNLDSNFKNKKRDSVEANQFEKSFELNKSNLSKNNRNSFDDQNPNFWETGQKPESQKNVNNSKQNKSINPFDEEQTQRKSAQMENPFNNSQFSKKGQNPFDDDNKSQLSQKNKTVQRNFAMNHSFTKSEKSNPFDSSSQTLSKKGNKNQKVLHQNSFQPEKQQFRPPNQEQKYDSVSQQASFKKIDPRQNNLVNTSVDNPFQTTTNQIDVKQSVTLKESLKLSIQGHQNKQVFDFDQFQNIKPRQSVRTSSFPNKKQLSQSNELNKNPFSNAQNAFQRQRQSQKQRSIRFSQLGKPNDSFNHSNQFVKRQPTEKQFNFDDFQNVGEPIKKTQLSHDGFSAFENSKIQKSKDKKNDLSGFQNSKQSKSDFFKQTSKQFKNEREEKEQRGQQNKSRHSGFSAFNLNVSNKSENKSQKKSEGGVNWNDFQEFNKAQLKGKQPGSELRMKLPQEVQFINTDRSQEQTARNNGLQIDKKDLKLNFSADTSKYQSPQFNVKYDSGSGSQQRPKNMISSQRSQNQNEQSSVKFEQFAPLQKKGYEWNPSGLINIQASKIYKVEDYDINQKKKQLGYFKEIYEKDKDLLGQAKLLYNQARKVYLEKIQKIDSIIKQKQSYRKILISLNESNQNKEDQIFTLNQRIKQMTALKERILQKQKLLFERSKSLQYEQQIKNQKYRSNNNKWQIFNRNLKIMRERESQSMLRTNNVSKMSYNYNRA